MSWNSAFTTFPSVLSFVSVKYLCPRPHPRAKTSHKHECRVFILQIHINLIVQQLKFCTLQYTSSFCLWMGPLLYIQHRDSTINVYTMVLPMGYDTNSMRLLWMPGYTSNKLFLSNCRHCPETSSSNSIIDYIALCRVEELTVKSAIHIHSEIRVLSVAHSADNISDCVCVLCGLPATNVIKPLFWHHDEGGIVGIIMTLGRTGYNHKFVDELLMRVMKNTFIHLCILYLIY